MDTVEFYRNLPDLRSPRLLLRKIRREDAPDYYAFAGDGEVTHFLRWGPHPSLAHSEKYLASVLDGYARGEDGPWGIERVEDGHFIGIVHLMEIDSIHKKADIGVVLARRFWGYGYARESLRTVIGFCFSGLDLNRVQGMPVAANFAARRMMEQCGMTCEGMLREYLWQKGAYQDFALYAILAKEYAR